MTKIFHPNVSKVGEICVSTLKKDWKPDLGIKHILLTIKCLLIVPNPESALNEEAGRLLLENYDEYFKHAKLITSIHAVDSQVQFDEACSPAIECDTKTSELPSDQPDPLNASPKKRGPDTKNVMKADLKKRTLRRL